MFTYIQPKDVRANWAFVKKGLEHILRKSPESWIPEDIYASCVNNTAVLCLAMENDKPIGFIVGYKELNAFHIWCAHGNSGGKLAEWFKMVESIAKSMDCKQITFASWRPAWNKVAVELGFKTRSWIKEL